MKNKTLLFISLLFAFLALVACKSGTGAGMGDEPVAQDSSEEMSVSDCAKPVPGTSLLTDAALGVCFLYPNNFEVAWREDGGLTLYVDSVLNTEAPLATIQFHSMDGRTIQEIIPDYPSNEELATMSLLTIDLGGEMATVVDNLPGQDVHRHVIALHNGRLIDIMIARIGPDYGAVGEQAEALYKMITDSFLFVHIEP